MFKSKKTSKDKKRSNGAGGGADLMKQLGFQIPNDDDLNMNVPDDDDDDETLENELKILQNDTNSPISKRSKTDKKKSAPDLQAFHNDVNKLLSDIDRPIQDEELSDGDEEELLAELAEMNENENETTQEHNDPEPRQSTVNNSISSTLQQRHDMYLKAVETAKKNGDAAKARRLDRQLKVIQELIQTARTGAPINESDIPPELFIAPSSSSETVTKTQDTPNKQIEVPPRLPETTTINKTKAASEPSLANEPSNDSDEEIVRLKSLARQAHLAGDTNKAKEYLIQMKQLQHARTAKSTNPSVSPTNVEHSEAAQTISQEESSTTQSTLLKEPQPRTVLEALQQRHEEIVKRHKEALSKGDGAKARRMDRVAKQYQEAIDATKRGRPYNYSELPELAGFAPIPIPQDKSSAKSLTDTNDVRQKTDSIQPTARKSSLEPQAKGSGSSSASVQPKPATTNDSIEVLRQKHHQLQQLALQEKRNGNIEAAKKHILNYREIEKKIASAESAASAVAIPIINDVEPLPPSETVRDDEYTEEIQKLNRDDTYRHLQDDLLRQIQLCARNQQIYAQMEGTQNVQQAQNFKILEQRCARHLEQLKTCYRNGLKVPLFHYEKRPMNIIEVNNDLTDHEFEVNIIRAINLHVPSGYSPTSLETYVVIEFPFPPESSQTARTRLGTGAAHVEYADSVHKFQIKRVDEKFKRLARRKELKLTIYYKVGFLRADRQLGIATVKLAALEQSSTVHESVDIFEKENKRNPEGKLEVKLRIKEALGQTKPSQTSIQRWLVIDRFEDATHSSSTTAPTSSTATATSITTVSRLVPIADALGFVLVNLADNVNNQNDTIVEDDSRSGPAVKNNDNSQRNEQLIGRQSVQLLKYEADLLQEQIEKLEGLLGDDEIEQFRAKRKTLLKQSDDIIERLREGGKQAIEEHVLGLRQLMERYGKEVDELRQNNDTKKADAMSKKQSIVAKEIATLTGQS